MMSLLIFFYFHFRASITGTRINIQTQTVSLMKKPSPLPKSAPAATAVVSNGSEDYADAADVAESKTNNSRAAVHAEQEDAAAAGDWRLQSHSLPSLGRASSGNVQNFTEHIPRLKKFKKRAYYLRHSAKKTV